VHAALPQRTSTSVRPPSPWPPPFVTLQKRQGFNLWAFLKTPYGMMAAFMLFSIFIMPRLKIDPEEYKEIMGQRDSDTVTPASITAAAQQQGRRRSD
jgi:hypothetical protein